MNRHGNYRQTLTEKKVTKCLKDGLLIKIVQSTKEINRFCRQNIICTWNSDYKVENFMAKKYKVKN